MNCDESGKENKECMDVRNGYIGTICMRTLVHRFDGSNHWSSKPGEECLKPGREKSFIVEWSDVAYVTQKPFTERIYFYFYSRDGLFEWPGVGRERQPYCFSAVGRYDSSVAPDASICAERGDLFKYAVRTKSYLSLSEKNAYRLLKKDRQIVTGGGRKKTKEEREEETRNAKESFDKALAEKGRLEQKINDCNFGELQQLSRQDPSTIDLAYFKQRLLDCDDSFKEDIDKLEETVDAVDLYVDEMKRLLDEQVNPQTEAELASAGRFGPFEQLFAEFELTSLHKIADLVGQGAQALVQNAEDFIYRLDDYYIRDLKEGYLATKLAWGSSYAFYPETFRGDESTETKIGYLQSVKKVAQYMGDIKESELIAVNEYGFDEDSPVPETTQASVVETIEPAFPEEGGSLKAALMSLHGTLTPEQERALLIVESFGHVIGQFSDNLSSIAEGMKTLLRQTASVITETTTCAAKVVAFGDFADYSEIVFGQDFCTGQELSTQARVVSALGLVVGTAKFWRALAEWGGLALEKGRKVSKALVSDARWLARVRDAARKMGMSKSEDVTHFAKATVTLSKSRFDKIIAAANKIYPSSRIQSIDSDIVKFSQSSVNDVAFRVDEFKQFGWRDSVPPIDVVKLGDGTLVSVDNTRLLAASRADINVKVRVRAPNETIDPTRAATLKDRQGNIPTTWEQAVRNRISNQKKSYREQYPNGSYVTGSVE
jgi:hypothetical protein